MAWISLFFMLLSLHAADLPLFLTKHSPETLRYISMDGRYAYVQKKPGVLGFVSSFKSVDFLSEAQSNTFLVKPSRFKTRLAIESIPNAHEELSLLKDHRIFVVDYGNTVTRFLGLGRNAKLHNNDEWISYYNMSSKVLHLQNLITQKKFEIKLSKKANPFFIPDVEMVTSNIIFYTDINEAGYPALVSYYLDTLKSSVIYKSPQNAAKLELCQHKGHLAMGEFPYEGVDRGSKVFGLTTEGQINLSGFRLMYSSNDQDIGNLVCLSRDVYFIKTMGHDKVLNHKVTEAVKLNLRSHKFEVKSDLKFVTQLIEMDDRILIPHRGELFVVEGRANITEDLLKAAPSKKEELQIDL